MSAAANATNPTSPRTGVSADQVIDVDSESPALLRQSENLHGGRDATDDNDDPDDGDAITNDDDEDDEDYGDDSDNGGLRRKSRFLHGGRHAVPMQSPAEESEPDLILETTMTPSHRRGGLPRIRKHAFFETEEEQLAAGHSASGGRILKRIAFRRRKRGEDDTFWTAVLISNLLSLAVMSCLVIYLTQTDFFEAHQSDLLGTTVDNRFTVVSQETADAKIYFKSGYSNSRYGEAMIAFGSGDLRLGRRALGPTDTQEFYGLSLLNNGTADFTNKIRVPFVKTDYLHATKAVVFDDGTVMTTAANMSGGINEVGDLNLVSQTGTISLSSGGNPVLVVDPDGMVNILKVDAEEPAQMGIVLDGDSGDISIADSFRIHNDVNATSVSSTNPLQFNTTHVLLGTTNSSKVTLTCPPLGSVQNNDIIGSKLWDYGRMTLEIAGQTATDQVQGGDVIINGGGGSDTGGAVWINGGPVVGIKESGERGSVMMNAQLGQTEKSLTEIGTLSSSHKVQVYGAVGVNDVPDDDRQTSFVVGGALAMLHPKNVTMDNSATSKSSVLVRSTRIDLTAVTATGSSSVRLGNSIVSIDAPNVTKIAATSQNVQIGSSKTAGLMIDKAGSMQLNAANSIEIRTEEKGMTTFIGDVVFGDQDVHENNSVPDMAISNGNISIDAEVIQIGAAETTTKFAVNADSVSIGSGALKSHVNVSGASFIANTQALSLGSKLSSVGIKGKKVDVGTASEGSVTIGSAASADVIVQAKTVSVKGSMVKIGEKDTESVTIGESGIATVEVVGKVVSVGANAESVQIGSVDTNVDIKGTLTLNGENLHNRHRRLSVDKLYGFVASDQHRLTFRDGSQEVLLKFLEFYSSSSDNIRVDPEGIQFRGQKDDRSMKHGLVALSIDNIRAVVNKSAADRKLGKLNGNTKFRCQVFKTSSSNTSSSKVVLEVTSILEFCSDSTCSGIFFSGSNQRIVSYQDGDRFHVSCSVSTGEATDVLIDRAQLDFSKL